MSEWSFIEMCPAVFCRFIFTVPSNRSGKARPINSFVCANMRREKMNMRREIKVFILWYLHLDMFDSIQLNVFLYQTTQLLKLGFLFYFFTTSSFSCCMFYGVSAFSLLYRWCNSCSIGLWSSDWFCPSKTLHFPPE